MDDGSAKEFSHHTSEKTKLKICKEKIEYLLSRILDISDEAPEVVLKDVHGNVEVVLTFAHPHSELKKFYAKLADELCQEGYPIKIFVR